ncbi:MAG TPA: NAD-dependent epimerase/dehydratase family protein [Acidimicrobiales bacterium]|jgi:UDP-glucose 4-epimerase|nr:NAD-dependent epimerase/dehydratase family protein [Acidimicrobiales bacterium]
MGRRILITGLASFWGGELAQHFEQDPSVDVVVGMDTDDPNVELERTEFVRTDDSYSILARIIRSTQVDTVVHAGLVVNSSLVPDRRLNEKNVIGTMNLLAALAGDESRVTSLVVKSSALVYGASRQDPTWFREHNQRSAPARTRIERSLLEVEDYLRSFAEEMGSIKVAVLRCANVLGTDLQTMFSRSLSMPVMPTIAGFDPQMQFVETGDVVRAIEFAVTRELEGVYNVAGDGRLPWSEIRTIAGRPPLYLSPVLTSLPAAVLSRLGLVKVPPEALDLLRFGRGIDNRKLKRAGFEYRYTTAGAVQHFMENLRIRNIVGHTEPAYRYQGDVEAFFRRSPAIVRDH